VRNVALGNVRRDAELDLGLQVRLRMLAPQLAHRLLEEMGVELQPDRRDVSGLLLSQQVTRAPDLEVVRRQAKSAAQVVELLEDPQALLCVWCDEVLAGAHPV